MISQFKSMVAAQYGCPLLTVQPKAATCHRGGASARSTALPTPTFSNSRVPRDVHVSSPMLVRAYPKSAGLDWRANLIAFIAKFAFLQPAGRLSAKNKRRCPRISRCCPPKPKGELQQKRRTLFLLLRDFPNHILLAENQCSIGHFVSLEPTRRNQGEWHEGLGQIGGVDAGGRNGG